MAKEKTGIEAFEEQIKGSQKEGDYNRTNDAIKHVLSTRLGRRFVYDLLGICHFGKSPFTGQDNLTNCLAGKQLVGEWVMDLLTENYVEAYNLMIKEAKEDYNNDRNNANASNSSGN